MKWLEISVRTPVEGVERVSEILLEIGTGGVAIEDPAVILEYAARTQPEEWGVPEPAADGLPLVKGYLPLEEGLVRRVAELVESLDLLALSPAPEVSTREVMDEDWSNSWKAYYKPVQVGRRLVVKPSWEEYHARGWELVIEIDPGMAFGCGTHATTSLCLGLLEKYIRPGMTVYDIGTGSGILAVAAALLGAGQVTAVDIDPVACRTAGENIERNGVADRVGVVQGDLMNLLGAGADLIVANIIASVITGLAPQAAGALAPGGIFVASGIIRERAEEVVAAFTGAGLTVEEQLAEGPWVALAGKKQEL
ncbi:50S ribosomal protein L11 methyltransferase [Pelotomaculum propionicicum]|uniref:50S ribosomal protein L11 methyltransferase n=1 Tax=Pelotomaculum propionicicum TaxID=258475 RepID=UPI0010664001|nr:50S ribosomal protein L11 methyltransferase [Pelotomaculum propionicicum]NLI12989.1 50S ribosomal protein L11 methyltransferase [Peptococcaceae bacterium]